MKRTRKTLTDLLLPAAFAAGAAIASPTAYAGLGGSATRGTQGPSLDDPKKLEQQAPASPDTACEELGSSFHCYEALGGSTKDFLFEMIGVSSTYHSNDDGLAICPTEGELCFDLNRSRKINTQTSGTSGSSTGASSSTTRTDLSTPGLPTNTGGLRPAGSSSTQEDTSDPKHPRYFGECGQVITIGSRDVDLRGWIKASPADSTVNPDRTLGESYRLIGADPSSVPKLAQEPGLMLAKLEGEEPTTGCYNPKAVPLTAHLPNVTQIIKEGEQKTFDISNYINGEQGDLKLTLEGDVPSYVTQDGTSITVKPGRNVASNKFPRTEETISMTITDTATGESVDTGIYLAINNSNQASILGITYAEEKVLQGEDAIYTEDNKQGTATFSLTDVDPNDLLLARITGLPEACTGIENGKIYTAQSSQGLVLSADCDFKGRDGNGDKYKGQTFPLEITHNDGSSSITRNLDLIVGSEDTVVTQTQGATQTDPVAPLADTSNPENPYFRNGSDGVKNIFMSEGRSKTITLKGVDPEGENSELTYSMDMTQTPGLELELNKNELTITAGYDAVTSDEGTKLFERTVTTTSEESDLTGKLNLNINVLDRNEPAQRPDPSSSVAGTSDPTDTSLDATSSVQAGLLTRYSIDGTGDRTAHLTTTWKNDKGTFFTLGGGVHYQGMGSQFPGDYSENHNETGLGEPIPLRDDNGDYVTMPCSWDPSLDCGISVASSGNELSRSYIQNSAARYGPSALVELGKELGDSDTRVSPKLAGFAELARLKPSSETTINTVETWGSSTQYEFQTGQENTELVNPQTFGYHTEESLVGGPTVNVGEARIMAPIGGSFELGIKLGENKNLELNARFDAGYDLGQQRAVYTLGTGLDLTF